MSRRELLLSLPLTLLACLAWTWPLALRASSAVPVSQGAAEAREVRVPGWEGSTWTLWWWSEAFTQGRDPLWCQAEFWPAGRRLGAASFAPLTALASTLLPGPAGSNGPPGVMLLGSLWTGMWLAWVLARRLGLATGAAAFAAVAWAWSPLARDAFTSNLLLAIAPWPPLALLALVGWSRASRGSLLWALWVGAAAGLALLASWPTGVATLALLALLALLAPLWRVGSARGRSAWLAGLAAFAGLGLTAHVAWPRATRLITNTSPAGAGPSTAEVLSDALPAEPTLPPLVVIAVLLALHACTRERRARALALAAAPLLLLAAAPALRRYLEGLLPSGLLPERCAWALVGSLPLALAAGAGFGHLASLRLARGTRATALLLLALQAWPRGLDFAPAPPPSPVLAIARLQPHGSVLTLPLALRAGPEQAWQAVHGHPVPLGNLQHLPARDFLAWSRLHPDLAGFLLGAGAAIHPEHLSLDLETLGIRHVLVDIARAGETREWVEVLDQMPRWQRGDSDGRALWWHRSSLAYAATAESPFTRAPLDARASSRAND